MGSLPIVVTAPSLISLKGKHGCLWHVPVCDCSLGWSKWSFMPLPLPVCPPQWEFSQPPFPRVCVDGKLRPSPERSPSVPLWYLPLSTHDSGYRLLLLSREVSERSHTRENPDALPPQATCTSCENRGAALESTGPLLARGQDGIWSHMSSYGH